VAYQYARRQLGDLRLIAGHSPGEDVDLDTSLGESLRDLDHVNVETARVAGPRLFKRRRMNADGRDAPWIASRHVPSPPELTNP
jgi:hypothetical protein